jgi:two-component sensor histidine kinase
LKKLWIIIVLVMTIILVGTNAIYYFTSKATLVSDQQNQIQVLVKSIQNSIDRTHQSEALFEKSQAESLRMASISIQESLPHDIDQVTNEQLAVLAKKLNLEAITLFTQVNGDFLSVKSGVPSEIGMKTNGWRQGTWSDMFSQLMGKDHNITNPLPNFGESSSHFWAGPTDTSSADSSKVEKYGYYNDGTTNYLIDPYLNNSALVGFQENAGANVAIRQVIKDNPFVLEVAVLNETLLTEKRDPKVINNVTWYTSKMVKYGTYNYSNNTDQSLVEKAMSTNNQVHSISTVNNNKIMKSFIPLDAVTNGNDRFIVVVSSDYKSIQASLFKQEIKLLFISLFCFVIGFILIFMLSRFILKQEKTMTKVQDMYSKNIESLFNSVKEHRHDFNNHIFTLSGLCSMKNYDEMEKYLTNMTQVHTQFNDIININIPAFSGLLQAKLAYASEKQIQFEHHFEGFDRANLDTLKVTDLVRIVGNVIDNAFYEVLNSQPNAIDRKVTLMGKIQNEILTFQIHNNGSEIPKEIIDRMFDHGFSTKKHKDNSGLGLAIAKQLVSKYKGSIEVTSNEELTSFTIKIPLAQREILTAA